MLNAQRLGASLLLSAALAAPALAQDVRTNGDVFKDVSSAVQTYTRFTIFDDVSASIDNGVVTLSGKVTMPFKRDDIAKRVAKVQGVSRVENQIGVLPVSPNDDDLRYVIARAIYGNSSFWQYASMSDPPIHIVVERGHVTLTGVVASEVDKMLARSLATGFNTLSVTSELKTDAEARAALEKARL
ncbi:MAG: BON domain-containing protein [Acidobacteriota bacterium]